MLINDILYRPRETEMNLRMNLIRFKNENCAEVHVLNHRFYAVGLINYDGD